jgi:predicted amidohydrolase YtcJ
MRELNRLGLTGVIDAGGGFQNDPEDYAVQKLVDPGARAMTFSGKTRSRLVHWLLL